MFFSSEFISALNGNKLSFNEVRRGNEGVHSTCDLEPGLATEPNRIRYLRNGAKEHTTLSRSSGEPQTSSHASVLTKTLDSWVKHMMSFAGQGVLIGKNCALGLAYVHITEDK